MQTAAASPLQERKIYQGVLQPRNFPGLPEGWISDSETFPSADSQAQLFLVAHHPRDWTSHKVLIIMHGMGEHGGRYLHFAHYLQKDVGAVYCLDMRGCGRSEGLRGHVDRFDSFCDDLAVAIKRIDEQLRKRFGKSEIHLLGHSLGGLVVLRTMFLNKELPVKSVTSSSAALGARIEVPLAKRTAAHLLSRIWGSLHMATELDVTVLSHDKDVAEAYVNDRLVHNKATPRFYTETVRAMADTVKRDSGFEYPLLTLVPMQDLIVDVETQLQFFRSLKVRDKQLRTYPGFYHESFNEIGKEQAFEDLRAWINSHSALNSSV